MCKATVQVGPRKGELCEFPAKENGYCNRHQRNFLFEQKTREGKRMCRFFFRGCDAEVKGEASCAACRERLSTKSNACQHEGCKFRVKEPGFCKKHERDKYRLEEQEKGIRYCDIARGCFTICKDGLASCDECLERARQKEKERFEQRKKLTVALQATTSSDMRVCVGCGKDFEKIMTKKNTESLRCESCRTTQKVQDKKRENRERNQKEEMSNNLARYFKEYINNAARRDKGIFKLTFEEFSTLVNGACYYCAHKVEGEVNGIDRINNDEGYTPTNCVSCCEKCNLMKSFYHPSFFLKKCAIITSGSMPSKDFFKQWEIYYSRSCFHNYGTYKRVAETVRNLPFHITQAQWDRLTRSTCYLCGYQSEKGIGLDRVDNSKREYTFENVRPCCGACNAMKNTLSLDEFMEKCKTIAERWPTTENFDALPVAQNPLKEYFQKGRDKETTERKSWKANGIYYAILSNNSLPFYDSFQDVLSSAEYTAFCDRIRPLAKEVAIPEIRALIGKLKQRRARAKAPATPAPSP